MSLNKIKSDDMRVGFGIKPKALTDGKNFLFLPKMISNKSREAFV